MNTIQFDAPHRQPLSVDEHHCYTTATFKRLCKPYYGEVEKLVNCVKCGKNLINECMCFTNDLDRIKEWKRLAQREICIIIEVLENNRSLFMRLVNSTSIEISTSITPLRNGIIASGKFALSKQGVEHFTRLELLDWNKKLIYFRPEDLTLYKKEGDELRLEQEWKLEIL